MEEILINKINRYKNGEVSIDSVVEYAMTCGLCPENFTDAPFPNDLEIYDKWIALIRNY